MSSLEQADEQSSTDEPASEAAERPAADIDVAIPDDATEAEAMPGVERVINLGTGITDIPKNLAHTQFYVFDTRSHFDYLDLRS